MLRPTPRASPSARRLRQPVRHPVGSIPTRVRVVFETRLLANECQINFADWAVALLADDDLGFALVGTLAVVDLVAIDEQDQVGVLFDGAGFAQIGHDRALVVARLEAAIELR